MFTMSVKNLKCKFIAKGFKVTQILVFHSLSLLFLDHFVLLYVTHIPFVLNKSMYLLTYVQFSKPFVNLSISAKSYMITTHSCLFQYLELISVSGLLFVNPVFMALPQTLNKN